MNAIQLQPNLAAWSTHPPSPNPGGAANLGSPEMLDLADEMAGS